MQQLHRRNRNGQVLVLVALSLLVLLGIVALAVDGGNLYAERRKMQNAADAGALAGARVLCYEEGATFGYPEGDVEKEAKFYAEEYNGADVADAWVTGNLTVTVVATKTATTFFARVIGFPTADVAARASAMCQSPQAAGDVWPLAIDDTVYSETIGCGQLFYAYISKDETKGISAADCDFTKVTIDGHAVSSDDWLPECFEQDTTYPVTTTVTHMHSSQRGWLDLFLPDPPYENPCKNKNCGEPMVECWIEFGHPPVNIDDCLAGEGGNMVALSDDVTARACEIWNLVLFDRVCVVGSEEDPPEIWYACNLKDALKSEKFYNVAGFGCMRVIGYFNAEFPCLKPEPISAQVVIVQKMCADMTDYEGSCISIEGNSTGEAPGPDDVIIIALSE